MTIELASVETFVLRLPARRDFRWLSLSRPLGEVVLARITDTDGLIGWGEVVALRDWGDVDGRRHGETSASVTAIVHEQLVPALLERPLLLGDLGARLDAAILGNPYAKALLDIALHDLAGRRTGVPVHDLLGGRARACVHVAHMLGLMDDDETLSEARAAVAEDGVTALQVKGGADPVRDIRIIAALRRELGPDVMLRVDANGGYRTRSLARQTLIGLAEAGADLVEQPLLGLNDLAEVRHDSPLPIIADEACWTPCDALNLVAARAVDALSVYVGKPGGIAPARAVCSIAAAARLPHDLNGALELGIGNAANLHVAFASPAELLPCVVPVNGPAGGGATRTAGRYFEDDIVVHAFAYAGGALLPNDEPGLGIEVDLDKVERYCVSRRTSDRRTAAEVQS